MIAGMHSRPLTAAGTFATVEQPPFSDDAFDLAKLVGERGVVVPL